MKNLLASFIFVVLLCSSSYAQQVVVPVTSYVPTTVVNNVVVPVYSTYYRPVTTYYYNPVVAAPVWIAPPYYNYIVQERAGLFGCQRTYVNIVPNYPGFFYGNQIIRPY
jgi:hypothetical protein